MDGVHDLGGMHGFGPVRVEQNEPVFHEPWEGRVFALNMTVSAFIRGNTDYFRSTLENIPAPTYLQMTYYERWFESICIRCQVNGLIDETALKAVQSGTVPQTIPPSASVPIPPDTTIAFLSAGNPSSHEIDASPRFSSGDQVRTRVQHTPTHTRLPRYARGKPGIVVKHHGAHRFPDTSAKFEGDQPAHLYTIQFPAQTLWGPEANANDTVNVDLWEPYLEPV